MDRIDRRTYLALVASGTIVITGCSSDGDGGEPTAERDDADRSAAETDADAPRSEAEADANTDAENETESDEEPEPDSDSESDHQFEIGDHLEVGDLHAVIAGFELTDELVTESDGGVLEAADGAAFAIVDLALQYAGDEPVVDISDAVAVGLEDDAGDEYDPIDEPVPLALGLDAGRLAPGELARGELVYDVDDDSDGLVLALESLAAEDVDEDEDKGEDEYLVVVDLEADGASDADADTNTMEPLEFDLDDTLNFSRGAEGAGVAVTVASLEQGNNLGGFMQSDEGHEIVAVGVTVENGSGRERTLSSDQIQLTDEFGRRHPEAPRAVRTLENIDGMVLSDGEKHEGKIAYQIETGLAELYWVFDFGEWGDDERVFWQLR